MLKKIKKFFTRFEIIETAFFIIKISFLTFGGSGVMLPAIRRKYVELDEYLTEKKFDQLLIIANTIPGPTAIQVLAYICIKKFGKFKGSLVCSIPILPHAFLSLLLFYLFSIVENKNYIYVFTIAVIPVVVIIVFAFFKRYIKIALKDTKIPKIISLVIFSLTYLIFVPTPYNLPAIPIFLIIILTFLIEGIRGLMKRKK